MNNEGKSLPEGLTKGRFIWGVSFFVIGQATTLLIPLVSSSGLSELWKAILSGTLFFVTPQLGIVLAVAVLGKAGYSYLKGIIFKWFRRYALPPEVVSLRRYRIGLVMFILPVLIGWAAPYFSSMVPGYAENETIIAIIGDIIFIMSVFVLGGEFWDKIRSLFVYKSKVQFE